MTAATPAKTTEEWTADSREDFRARVAALNPKRQELAGDVDREVTVSWTVMAEVADPVTGEPTWLRNDIKAGDDPQRDACSPIWDLLEHKGYTVLSTVACPTEFACNDCGIDENSPSHGKTIPC